jgi:DNA-binding MltR family transcriptional regulator
MASALKSLLKEKPTIEDIQRCVKELQTDGVRGVAVLACALLEDVLRLAILNKMVDLTKDEQDRLFVGITPIGTLSAKTQIAYAFGIIDPATRNDLNVMREIRNGITHTTLNITFDTPEIANLCNNLNCLSPSSPSSSPAKPFLISKAKTPRERYVAAAEILMLELIATFANRL